MRNQSMMEGEDTNRKMFGDMKVAVDNEEP